jgi:hypothetical protein
VPRTISLRRGSHQAGSAFRSGSKGRGHSLDAALLNVNVFDGYLLLAEVPKIDPISAPFLKKRAWPSQVRDVRIYRHLYNAAKTVAEVIRHTTGQLSTQQVYSVLSPRAAHASFVPPLSSRVVFPISAK